MLKFLHTYLLTYLLTYGVANYNYAVSDRTDRRTLADCITTPANVVANYNYAVSDRTDRQTDGR